MIRKGGESDRLPATAGHTIGIGGVPGGPLGWNKKPARTQSSEPAVVFQGAAIGRALSTLRCRSTGGTRGDGGAV